LRLSDLPPGVRVFGNVAWRGQCPPEHVEQVTAMGWLRRTYPDTWGALALHPRNEQQLRGGQFRAIHKQKAEGLTKGASDLIIPARVAFVCELKRRDHTKSTWQDGQREYLEAAARCGAFACVALGADGVKEAVAAWLASIGDQA
jgi:hypothetical protein